MSKYNWRNMKWNKMGVSEKAWVIIIYLLLAVLLVFIYLDGTNIVDIPDWAILMWAVIAVYAAYKNVVGNNLFNDEELDNESNPDDDDE